MYYLTKKQKEVIHKALITASDNGTLEKFTNEELKLINRAETIVNKLTIPDVVGRSEQLPCKCCGDNKNEDGKCINLNCSIHPL